MPIASLFVNKGSTFLKAVIARNLFTMEQVIVAFLASFCRLERKSVSVLCLSRSRLREGDHLLENEAKMQALWKEEKPFEVDAPDDMSQEQ